VYVCLGGGGGGGGLGLQVCWGLSFTLRGALYFFFLQVCCGLAFALRYSPYAVLFYED
jgi:hypothetical protein